MPRFYFDVFDGTRTTTDQDGIVVADIGEVSALAVEALPEIARDQLPNGDHLSFAVTVRTEDGTPIFKATLSLSSEWLR